MIVKVTLAPHEIQNLITEHLKNKFKALVTDARSEYIEVKFPEPPKAVEATCEVQRIPPNPRD